MAIPSGYTALDFVGFTDKGTYANNITYVKNDLAHYGGDIWKCLVDNTIGVTPSEGVNWTLWIGAPTNLVERIIAPLETNPATVAYAVGRQIIYDDWLWEVIAPIAVGDSLIDYAVDPTNANIKKSPSVETQVLAIKNGLGTAAAKDFTTSVTSGSADLVTSGAVYSEVDALSTALTNKVNTSDVVNNLTTTASGKVLDARQGKALNDALSTAKGNIAYTNTSSTTASKAYQKNEEFFLDDILRIAKTDISNGDTLTLDSNYEDAGKISTQIFQINSDMSYKQNASLYSPITINGTSRTAVESALNLIASNLNQSDTTIDKTNFSAHVTTIGCLVVLNGEITNLTAQSTAWQTVSTDSTKIPLPAFSPNMIAGDHGRVRLIKNNTNISLDCNVDGENITSVNFVLVYVKAV